MKYVITFLLTLLAESLLRAKTRGCFSVIYKTLYWCKGHDVFVYMDQYPIIKATKLKKEP